MINKVDVTKSFVEAQEEFLTKLQKAVAEGLKAPLGLIVDNTPEPVKRTHIIIDIIRKEFPDVASTFVIPGTVIQLLFPKKELLVTIVCLLNKMSQEKTIKLELCKLASDE